MQNTIFHLVAPLAGLAAGSFIGLGFGALQGAALRQNQNLQTTGQLKSGWRIMPGSGGRVALLLLTMALIQWLCPILFMDGIQWWVSGGVVLGYGWMLFRQLRLRMSQVR